MSGLTSHYVRIAAREAWGEVQTCRQLPQVKGVYEVMTAGHGGYLVSDELFDLRPELLIGQFAGAGWSLNGRSVITFYQFEEDCDWAVLALAHPEVFDAMNVARRNEGSEPITIEYVRDVVERWNPDLFETLTGLPAARD